MVRQQLVDSYAFIFVSDDAFGWLFFVNSVNLELSIFYKMHLSAQRNYMLTKFIVIGASAASVSFMTKLRSFDQVSTIICFSAESNLPYNRCLLADVTEQAKNLTDIELKPEAFFTQHAIDLRLNSWVSSIDRVAKTVTVNGYVESYNYLFIGTGTQQFVPAIAGTDLVGVFGFHTADSVDRLDKFIHNMMPKTATVIGAGINGMEAVSALVARGLKVSLIDQHATIMPLQVDAKVAAYIERLASDAGVVIYKGQQVVAIEQRIKSGVGRIKFASGAALPTDCVVLATGSTVNSQLVSDAGLQMHKGSLLVNNCMQTSDAAIYAGGDVCATADIVSGEIVKSATWADAMLQGLTAATQFSDKPRNYPGVVGMRDSTLFGREFYACGQTVDVDIFERIEIANQDLLHVFYLFDNQLKGFVLFGNVEKLAQYRTWYLTGELVCKENFSI